MKIATITMGWARRAASGAILALALLCAPAAHATSTINPSVPAQNAPLNSAPIRQNFLAAYTDFNNLLSQFYGPLAPVGPSNMQTWADSSSYPTITLRIYNAFSATWLAYAQINAATGAYTPTLGTVSQGQFLGNMGALSVPAQPVKVADVSPLLWQAPAGNGSGCSAFPTGQYFPLLNQNFCWHLGYGLFESDDPSILVSITEGGTVNVGGGAGEKITFAFGSGTCSVANGGCSVQYVNRAGDTTTTVATGLVAAIKANANLFNPSPTSTATQGEIHNVTNGGGTGPIVYFDFDGRVPPTITFTALGGSTVTQTVSPADCATGCTTLELDAPLQLNVYAHPGFTPSPGSNIFQLLASADYSGGSGAYGNISLDVIDPTTSAGRWLIAGSAQPVTGGVYIGAGLYGINELADKGSNATNFQQYWISDNAGVARDEIVESGGAWTFAAATGHPFVLSSTGGFGYDQTSSAGEFAIAQTLLVSQSGSVPTAGAGITLFGGSSPVFYTFDWGASTYKPLQLIGLSWDFKPSNSSANGVSILANLLRPDGNAVTALGDSSHVWSDAYATLTHATGLPVSTGLSGLGTGVATALGIATNSAGGVLTSPLPTLTFGTHLAAGAASYNGSAIATLTSDATSANTVSTIVARDGSGNFSAGTITASLTGHASLDLALSGLGTGVQTALGVAANGAGGFVTSPVANANLANASLTIGSTNIALGATSTTLAGLTSVAATTFTGALTGHASLDLALAGGTTSGQVLMFNNSSALAFAAPSGGAADAHMGESAGGNFNMFAPNNSGSACYPNCTFFLADTASNGVLSVSNGSASPTLANDYVGDASTLEATSIALGSAALYDAGGLAVAKKILGGSSILSNAAAGGIGYTTGAGCAVTQASSRTTGVTCAGDSGAITLVSAAGSATASTFTVTDTSVAATDTVICSQKSGNDKYECHVTAVAAGTFNVTIFTTGGTTTEQPVLNFAIIKAVTSELEPSNDNRQIPQTMVG